MGKRLLLVLMSLLSALIIQRIVTRFVHWRRRTLRRLTNGSRIIETRSGSVETIIHGDGEAILLIHGSPGGCDFWQMYRDLVPAGFQIVCPSRPGYLNTPLTSGNTVNEQAQMLSDLLDSLEISSATIIGFSGGAPIALQMAISFPERITAMVIESGVTRAIDITDTTEDWFLKTANATPYLQRILYWVGQRLVRIKPGFVLWSTIWLTTSHKFREVWNCMRYIVTHPEQLRLFWRLFDANLPYSKRVHGYNNDITILANLPDFTFEDIRCPVLFIHSLYDRDVAIEHATRATSQIPDAKMISINGCGHFIWLGKQREEVLSQRLQFLKTHYSSKG